jgi:large subunit ribosomal protein L13Ae
MFQKVVIVDCYGHLMGRLASIIAKELLNGQRVVLVRTEELNISGSLFRNKEKFARFVRKVTSTNPTRGPWHYRSPSKILWRVIRGMLPHKTERGKAALDRLKTFEGIPHPFNRLKRQVIPAAFKNLRLRPGRKFCRLGDLASESGWKHGALINTLEAKRKVSAAAYYQTKKQLLKLRTTATKNVDAKLKDLAAPLAALGHPLKL